MAMTASWAIALANVLDGGLGNDTLDGGAGNDTLDGDAGTDLVSYGSATGGVTVNLGAGTSSGAAGNDSLTGIEIVLGGNFADSILGDGLANVLDGRLGNDTLDGGGGDDWASYRLCHGRGHC
jgi:Ca2+-binding RTX toxin-like protein